MWAEIALATKRQSTPSMHLPWDRSSGLWPWPILDRRSCATVGSRTAARGRLIAHAGVIKSARHHDISECLNLSFEARERERKRRRNSFAHHPPRLWLSRAALIALLTPLAHSSMVPRFFQLLLIIFRLIILSCRLSFLEETMIWEENRANKYKDTESDEKIIFYHKVCFRLRSPLFDARRIFLIYFYFRPASLCSFSSKRQRERGGRNLFFALNQFSESSSTSTSGGGEAGSKKGKTERKCFCTNYRPSTNWFFSFLLIKSLDNLMRKERVMDWEEMQMLSGVSNAVKMTGRVVGWAGQTTAMSFSRSPLGW